MWNSGSQTRGRRVYRSTVPAIDPTARSRELAAHIALLDLAPDAIFARDVDRRITFWNRGAQTTYGFSPAEALGVAPSELLRTEYPIPLEEIERLVTETGSWEGDLVQHTKDGRRLVVESRWAAHYDETGTLVGLLEVNRDITARLQSQTALLELAPDAIVGIGRRWPDRAGQRAGGGVVRVRTRGAVGAAGGGAGARALPRHASLSPGGILRRSAHATDGRRAGAVRAAPGRRRVPRRDQPVQHRDR